MVPGDCSCLPSWICNGIRRCRTSTPCTFRAVKYPAWTCGHIWGKQLKKPVWKPYWQKRRLEPPWADPPGQGQQRGQESWGRGGRQLPALPREHGEKSVKFIQVLCKQTCLISTFDTELSKRRGKLSCFLRLHRSLSWGRSCWQGVERASLHCGCSAPLPGASQKCSPISSNLCVWSRSHRVPRGMTGDKASGRVSPDLFLVPELKSLR